MSVPLNYLKTEGACVTPNGAKFKNDIAGSFQKTICDILEIKTKRAIFEFKNKHPNKKTTIVVAGGVAANQEIKKITKNKYSIKSNALYIFLSLQTVIHKIMNIK